MLLTDLLLTLVIIRVALIRLSVFQQEKIDALNAHRHLKRTRMAPYLITTKQDFETCSNLSVNLISTSSPRTLVHWFGPCCIFCYVHTRSRLKRHDATANRPYIRGTPNLPNFFCFLPRCGVSVLWAQCAFESDFGSKGLMNIRGF